MSRISRPDSPARTLVWVLLWCCLIGVRGHAAPALTVGTAADYPPIVYRQDGVVVGIEADMARLLGAQLGHALQFSVMPAAALLPALEKGEIDLVMSGWRRTPEREQRVLLTRSYLDVGLMAIIRTEDVMRFHNPAALLRGGYKVAAVNGAAPPYIEQNFQNVTRVDVASPSEGLQALQNRRADVFLDDAASSWNIATDGRYGDLMSLGRLLTEEPLVWAVSKDHPELRDRIDRALMTLRQTGALEHVYNRWIPMKSTAADLP